MTSKNQGELLNSKREFNHPPLARVVVEKRNPGKNNASKKSDQMQPHSNLTIKSTTVNSNEDSFPFGIEVNSRPENDGKSIRVQLSSEQEIHLESTMLNL